MSDRSPTLAEVIRAGITFELEGVNTSVPGVVTRYDAATQEADVQPLVKAAYLDEAGARVSVALPVIPSCPVYFPGARGMALVFGIEPGDTGLLVFSQASLDKWLARGGLVDPGLDHRHNLSDAVFFAGLRPFSAALEGAPSDARVMLGQPSGTRVEVVEGQVRLGGDSGLAAVARVGDTVVLSAAAILACIAPAVSLTGIPAAGPAASGSISTGSAVVKSK